MLVLFLVIGIQLAVSQIVSHKKRLHSAVAEYAGAVLCNARHVPVSKQKPELLTTMKSLAVDLAHFRAQRPSYFIGERCMEDRAWV